MAPVVKQNARKAPETTGVERNTKRPRLEESKVAKFTSIAALQAALNANNKRPCAALVQALTTLRNQISLRHAEVEAYIEDPRTKLVQHNDERLLLAEEWCKVSPGLPVLFEVWNETFDESAAAANGSQGVAMANSVASLVLSVFSSILTLLSTSYVFQAAGIQIIKNFTPDHWRRLNTYVTGQGRGRNNQGPNNELILVSLRLLAVMSEKWDSKRVYESFAWESKALPKLLTMRRKGDSSVNPLVKPDIRTAYIVFLLSFLSNSVDSRVSSQTKTTFLSTPASASAFHPIFKTLHSDHATVIKRVLEVAWEGVWCDIRISRTLKISVFGDLHGVLGHFLKLYDNTDASGADYSPADLVHHFLLAICTRPGVGLCFKDRGWYPREGEEDALEAAETRTTKDSERGKIYNVILSGLLRMLKVTDDPRQQELALKILQACPELAAGYLPASGLTLDPPRLSSKWLANIAFVTGVINLPVPVESFHLHSTQQSTTSEGTLYNPVPPPVATILGNIIPASQNLNMKNVFTKGLQFTTTPANSGSKGSTAASTTTTSPSLGNLVQHTTALSLIKCLDKLARVKEAFEEVASALGEGEAEGQWTRRLKEVMREVRRRLPEFQVVVAFCSAHLRAFAPAESTTTNPSVVQASSDSGTSSASSVSLIKKKALLAECAMRLLWMYQKCLPEVVEGARFDVGKILVGFEFAFPGVDPSDAISDRGEDESDEDDGEDKMDEDEDGEREEPSEGDEQDEGESDGGEDGPAAEQEKTQESEDIDVARRLHRITQLHILRFLKESNTFVASGGWTGKSHTSASGQSQTHLHTLLTQFIRFHPSSATGNYELSIHGQITSLVKHVLASTLLFQDDPDEVDFWLNSLPYGVRRVKVVTRSVKREGGGEGEDAGRDEEDDEDDEIQTITVYPETPDGTPLTDEREAVIAFLDECVQRCLKAPYKYIEEMESFANADSTAMDVDSTSDSARPSPSTTASISTPSPLLCTVVEQLAAKVRAKLLSPSDLLAITTFLRKLLFALLGRTDLWTVEAADGGSLQTPNPNLAVLVSIAKKISESLDVEKLVFGDEEEGSPRHGLIKQVVRREVDLMVDSLYARLSNASSSTTDALATAKEPPSQQEVDDIDDFLELVEGLDLPPSKRERQLTAFELVDWVRLLDSPLNAAQTKKIFEIVKEFGGAWGVRDLVGVFDVGSTPGLVEVLEVVGREEMRDGLPFEYLLRHASAEDLVNPEFQKVLVDSATQHGPKSFFYSPANSDSVVVYATRVIRVILHHLQQWRAKGEGGISNALLLVLVSFLAALKSAPQPFEAVKSVLFGGQLPAFKGMLLSLKAVSVSAAIAKIQATCLDFTSAKDRELVRDTAIFWRDQFLSWMEQPTASNASNELAQQQVDYALSWIRFLDPLALLDCLESTLALASTTSSNRTFLALLQVAADPLRALASGSGSSDNVALLSSRLSLLFKLQAMLSTSASAQDGPGDEMLRGALEELIATALESTLPVGVMGTSTLSGPPSSLAELLRDADSRWKQSRREGVAARLDVASLLGQGTFTNATGRIIASLLYRESGSTEGGSAEEAVLDWLESEGSSKSPLEDLVPVLHSVLHTTLHRPERHKVLSLFGDNKRLSKVLQRLAKAFGDEGYSPVTRGRVQAVVKLLFQHGLSDETRVESVEHCLKQLRKAIPSEPAFISPEWISLVYWVQAHLRSSKESRSLVNEAIESTLQYLTRQLGGQDGSSWSDLEDLARNLSGLVETSKDAEFNQGTIETLFPVIIEHHLAQPVYLMLVEAFLRVANLKPLVVNRYLQAIVQHPRFYRLLSTTASPESLSIKEAITSVLHTLFHLHPSNTCQVSHVEPLVRIYRGTLSKPDRRILDILQLFEGQRKLSVAELLAKWSNSQIASSVYTPSSSSLEAVQSLDATLVLQTALALPYWRHIDQRGLGVEAKGREEQLYDPVFLMLLFGHVLSENPPSGPIGWIELFRTNVVGVVVRTLSSSHEPTRRLALSLLVGVWKLVEGTELQEKGHLLYVMNQIKNLFPSPSTSSSDAYPPRLPSYITLLLFHALRGIFNPSHFMYPLTSRFLLQRPEIDMTDVPMLYSLLYSSVDDRWRKERGWILRFLADGMLATGSGSQDWKILKRRHTWDLLASLYQSASEASVDKEKGLRQAILCVLVNLTRHSKPCSSLVLKSGLLAWIEMQLKREIGVSGGASRNEGVAWIKIIENVVLVLDKDRLEGTSLEGEWQATLWRSIALLLSKHAFATQVLPFAARVMLRLGKHTGPDCKASVEAMSLAVQRLEDLEAGIQLPDAQLSSSHALPALDDLLPPALHASYELHDKPQVESTFALWGRLVEIMWRTVMAMNAGSEENEAIGAVWAKLTSRLLVWGSIVGPGRSEEAEWARIESVKLLG
ncbi:hypothetical protein CC1G_06685 [Coprinopsis cinerea okayama7|uniref:Uncharacterized protein n=1 Tax=Coprinopsis cinerea (strain Okayama-7 / 130 / ATCC MYA-4618 / FGSC 9003) TaxID=240176 RepID=A8P808_COPC7|nr:hypothetical protein CC1G_06685 [Coprinopsis cinerea okayama7\|eukprot:XP_001839472.1 hypothetical protein CC1G_06685 [Coprinopsis cinerea okayama7\